MAEKLAAQVAGLKKGFFNLKCGLQLLEEGKVDEVLDELCSADQSFNEQAIRRAMEAAEQAATKLTEAINYAYKRAGRI